MADPDNLLVTRRSKRSTAGNRMDMALAELALENPETTEDGEADVDFVVKGGRTCLWCLIIIAKFDLK